MKTKSLVSAIIAVIELLTVFPTLANAQSGTTSITTTYNVIHVVNVYMDDFLIELTVGDTYQLNATVMPEDATNKSLIWTSTNEVVASVNENGSVVAKKKGSCEVICTSVDENISARCTVIVNDPLNGGMRGDVTGDGKVNTSDAVNLLRHIANILRLVGDHLTAADANNDRKVNTADAVCILKHCAGIELIPGTPAN